MKELFRELKEALRADFVKWKRSVRDRAAVRRFLLHALIFVAVVGFTGLLMVLAVSGAIVDHESPRVSDHLSVDGFSEAYGDGYDCIMVLGCGVKEDGTPTDRLRDRVKVGVALYKAGAAPKLLMSGDHGSENYDEVTAMRNLAIELGVPKEDIFLDHAGFSTYESVYRAQYIFSCDKMIVVTQEYHLYRALYIAESFGIEARGVSADLVPYARMLYHNCRETLARCKDFFFTLTKPNPTYLGDKIDLSGDGSTTHEETGGRETAAEETTAETRIA